MLILVTVIAGLVVVAAALLLALTPLIDTYRHTALRRTLTGVCRILEAHDVEYWCDFGTLLGFYRENDIIRHDKDADLGVLASEAPRIKALAPVFLEHGYWLTDQGGRAKRLLRIHDQRTWYYVDIYTYVPDGDTLRSVFLSPQHDLPASFVVSRVRAPFLGTTVHVPADVPGLVRHRYGSRFNVPRRGDKGRARRYSRFRSIGEDLLDNALGVRALLRSALR